MWCRVRKMEEGEVEELSLTFNVTVDSTVWGMGEGVEFSLSRGVETSCNGNPNLFSPLFLSLSFFSLSPLLLSRSAVVVLCSY